MPEIPGASVGQPVSSLLSFQAVTNPCAWWHGEDIALAGNKASRPLREILLLEDREGVAAIKDGDWWGQ